MAKKKTDGGRGKRNWTGSEDTLLREAVKQFKGNWGKIAECLTDRTDVQCLNRWTNSLNPELKKGPWKCKNDSKLKEGAVMEEISGCFPVVDTQNLFEPTVEASQGNVQRSQVSCRPSILKKRQREVLSKFPEQRKKKLEKDIDHSRPKRTIQKISSHCSFLGDDGNCNGSISSTEGTFSAKYEQKENAGVSTQDKETFSHGATTLGDVISEEGLNSADSHCKVKERITNFSIIAQVSSISEVSYPPLDSKKRHHEALSILPEKKSKKKLQNDIDHSRSKGNIHNFSFHRAFLEKDGNFLGSISSTKDTLLSAKDEQKENAGVSSQVSDEETDTAGSQHKTKEGIANFRTAPVDDDGENPMVYQLFGVLVDKDENDQYLTPTDVEGRHGKHLVPVMPERCDPLVHQLEPTFESAAIDTESFGTCFVTPATRKGIESPSAWKSPWYYHRDILCSYNMDITIEDVKHLMSLEREAMTPLLLY